ncbi:hypothetical protein, partial [Endozoicomonas lisbonensis]
FRGESGSVDWDEIFPIDETQIKDDSISTPKLQANSVIAEKVEARAITAEKIAVDAIAAEHISTKAITAEKIDAGEAFINDLGVEVIFNKGGSPDDYTMKIDLNNGYLHIK